MKEVVRVCFLWCILCFAYTAEAATLYFEPSEVNLYPGDTRTVAIRIDTEEGECVNVVDGVLIYPDIILPVDISLGESILPVWVEAPQINTDTRTITFAGGIPNGYCGRIEGDPRLTNTLLEIVVQYPGFSEKIGSDDEEVQEVSIAFSKETSVYLNDGSGNRTQLLTLDAAFILHKEAQDEVVNEWSFRVESDIIPPNSFSINLESDPSIFRGEHFIVFNTSDKQSGIDHYEVIEEPLEDFRLFTWGGVDAKWKEVRSPYKLKDQSLNSTIRVKAIDKAGNEYMAVLVPQEGMRGLSIRERGAVVLGSLGILILFGLIISFGVYWMRTRDLFEHEVKSTDSVLPGENSDSSVYTEGDESNLKVPKEYDNGERS